VRNPSPLYPGASTRALGVAASRPAVSLSCFKQRGAAISASSLVRPEVREPAHWFDPGVVIAIEDAVVISAIDEVYPELRLAERIAADRLAIRQIRPEVMEPVHYRDIFGARERDVLGEVRAMLGKQRG
jgi:hypothetical protein